MKTVNMNVTATEYDLFLKPWADKNGIGIAVDDEGRDIKAELPTDDEPMQAIDATSLGSAAPICQDTGTEHWRVEQLAQKLFIASQAREALTPATAVNKLEALACFWAAANFVTVSAALAHTYGDDGLPVGKDFDEFVETFLGKERCEELSAELSAQGY